MKKLLYLDYAAATPVAPEVLRAMQPYWRESFANASSLHTPGVAAKQALERFGKTTAALLHCLPDEIIFTSGGTESVNTALKGYVSVQRRKQHLISTNVEHAATLAAFNRLKKNGHAVTLVPCDTSGSVKPQTVLAAIKPNTTLISVILVQNEIGTIEPVAEIGKALIAINRERAKKHLPYIALHTDAAQAPAWLDLNVEKLHVDMLSLDASKCFGPKGAGLLVKRRSIALEPMIEGGGQQHSRRSGTEPLALIAGMVASLEYVARMRPHHIMRVTALRNYALARITDEIPGAIVTGHLSDRIANNISVAIAGVEGETLVLRLDRAGIAVSTGSACSTADLEPSHVIAALQLPAKYRNGSLRLTLGYAITKHDIDRVVSELKRIVNNLHNK